MSEGRWDAIVIGSGLGGLTSAAYLASNGMRTLVLEQYDVAGGSTHVFRRKRAFEFDVGVHYLGDCAPGGMLPRILRGVGLEGRIDFLPMDPEGFDTLLFPDFTFRVRSGWERYEADLLAAFPNEQHGLRKCVGVLRKLATQAMSAGPPAGALDLLTTPLRAPTLVRWNNRTLAGLFDTCALSERARAVLAAQSGTYGAPPSRVSVLMHAVLVDHYVRSGGYYPRGGGQVIAANLLEVIHAHGGRVRTHARVEQIVLDAGRAVGVRLADGEQLRAPVVISDADFKRTLLELVGPRNLSRSTLSRLGGMRMSLPLFCVYLGLDVDLRERMPNTNYYLFGDWDQESAYDDCYHGRFPANPPVYMTVASVKDPHTRAIAPPGCTSLQLMTIAPAQHAFWRVEQEPTANERYSRNPAYRAVKDEMTERVIDEATRLLPDPRAHRLEGGGHADNPRALHPRHRRDLLWPGALPRPVGPSPPALKDGDRRSVPHRGEHLLCTRRARSDARRRGLRERRVETRPTRRDRGRARVRRPRPAARPRTRLGPARSLPPALAQARQEPWAARPISADTHA